MGNYQIMNERLLVPETQGERTEEQLVWETIPVDWVCIYHKILRMFSNYGVDMLKDCCASCKQPNNNAIQLLNMFTAAVAARRLGLSLRGVLKGLSKSSWLIRL